MAFPAHRDFALQTPSFAPLGRVAFVIADEAPADIVAREALLDECFGPARFLKTCQRLRDGQAPAEGLALAAKDGAGELVGTLRLWSVAAGAHAALLLGPLAVAREARSLGLGGALIREALTRAKARGHRAVLLVGDEPYYARFGFERRFTEKLVMPGPVERARFLGLELEPGALEGAKGRVRATLAPIALTRAA
ncbi:MAG: N-acetyltransferase [Methylocystis sp.]|nr:N-acetyltransferase [Methylocystis sp.]